jgi:hypothetical protein
MHRGSKALIPLAGVALVVFFVIGAQLQREAQSLTSGSFGGSSLRGI